MYLIRDIMYCKPGKVRPMVDKFLAMNALGVKVGMPPMKIMTDFRSFNRGGERVARLCPRRNNAGGGPGAVYPALPAAWVVRAASLRVVVT